MFRTALPIAFFAASTIHASANSVTIDQIDIDELRQNDDAVEITDASGEALAHIIQIDGAQLSSNAVSLTVSGDNNGLSAPGAFSTELTALGLEKGTIEQRGDDNRVRLEIEGSDNLFAMVQAGNGNSVTGMVSGNGNSAATIQTGNGNIADFVQAGAGNSLLISQ